MNTRRDFCLQGGTAAGVMVLGARTAFGSDANSRIRLGVIGCGGRGHFIAQQFFQHAEGQFEITAIQDPFSDRLQSMKDRYDIPSAKKYAGLNAWREMLDGDVDAAIITSPPVFHPDQVDAAVDAGKHVWLAKPVAADAHGCQRIRRAAKRAQGHTTFLVDFQARNSPNFIEVAKRVHRGDIGDIVLGHVYYHAGRLPVKEPRGSHPDEFRLRNWVFYRDLSGDIIVEQNVHVLDVANWLIGQNPVKATGTGGRKARVDVGDCYDHFVVSYEYPGGVKVDFSSAQFTRGYSDLCARMYGTKGTAETHYAGANWGRGPVAITGDNPWPGVERDNTWDAVTRNVTDFVESCHHGGTINQGDYAADSCLVGVLGRVAAYCREDVYWDEIVNAPPEYQVNLDLD